MDGLDLERWFALAQPGEFDQLPAIVGGHELGHIDMPREPNSNGADEPGS